VVAQAKWQWWGANKGINDFQESVKASPTIATKEKENRR